MRQRKGPAEDRPSRHRSNGYPDPNPLPGHQRHEPLDAEDRADAAVLAAAHERGYRLAVRCTRCNQWLVAPTSVRLHMGPVCRTKVAA
jgi:hypothetical protein